MRHFIAFGILAAGLSAACVQPPKDAQVLQDGTRVQDTETSQANVDSTSQGTHMHAALTEKATQDNKRESVTMPMTQNSSPQKETPYWVKDMTADIYTQGKVKIGSLKFQDQVTVYQENDGWVKIDPISDKWMRIYNLVARRPHTPLRPLQNQTRSGIGWVDPDILKVKPD